MTVAQVNEILKGTFENEADRLYWENKKAELIRKNKTAEENRKYLKINAVYDR